MNLPNSATVEDVEAAYMLAYDKKMLGITVYRDGSRDSQVLTTGASYARVKPEGIAGHDDGRQCAWGTVIPVSDNVIGLKRKLKTGCGNVFLNALFDARTGAMRETFLDRGGQGSCLALLSTVSRLISRALRLGDTPESIAEQLGSTLPCPSYSARRGAGKECSPGFSCASSVGIAMRDMDKQFKEMMKSGKINLELLKNGETSQAGGKEPVSTNEAPVTHKGCPECDGETTNDGGCTYCPACGYSRCG